MDQRAVPLRNGLEWFFGDGRPFKENTMRICCDFHSHTIYGDGRNTPEEMIQAACALGFTDFGISEHGFLDHYAYSETGTFGMDETAYLRYREEMEALKEKYRNRIRIYTGVERDGMGPKQEADYVIGSTHQLFKDGEYVMVDESEEILADAVNRLWRGDWYAMNCDGVLGYISADYVRPYNPAAASAVGAEAVEIAMQYLGVPYVYGGASSRGFDCSGFTMYVFGQLGYSLPHSATSQWESVGEYVERSDLQPGDLVLFCDPSRSNGKACSHVGIYIGDNEFIHASTSYGVRISSLDESYYNGYYKGAKRLG